MLGPVVSKRRGSCPPGAGVQGGRHGINKYTKKQEH